MSAELSLDDSDRVKPDSSVVIGLSQQAAGPKFSALGQLVPPRLSAVKLRSLVSTRRRAGVETTRLLSLTCPSHAQNGSRNLWHTNLASASKLCSKLTPTGPEGLHDADCRCVLHV